MLCMYKFYNTLEFGGSIGRGVRATVGTADASCGPVYEDCPSMKCVKDPDDINQQW